MIPRELDVVQPDLEAMKATYDTLETFEHTFTDEEFKRHWESYGWVW
jgi:hypothetical protein